MGGLYWRITKKCDTFAKLPLEKADIMCVSGVNKQAALLLTQIKNRMEDLLLIGMLSSNIQSASVTLKEGGNYIITKDNGKKKKLKVQKKEWTAMI